MRTSLNNDSTVEEERDTINGLIRKTNSEIEEMGQRYCGKMEQMYPKIQLTLPKRDPTASHDIHYFDTLQQELWKEAQRLRTTYRQKKKNQDDPLYMLGTRILLSLAAQRRKLKKKINDLMTREKKLKELFTTNNDQKSIG